MKGHEAVPGDDDDDDDDGGDTDDDGEAPQSSTSVHPFNSCAFKSPQIMQNAPIPQLALN